MVNCWYTHDAPLNLDFFEIGNPVFLGMQEEMVEDLVNQVCDYIWDEYPKGKLTFNDFHDILSEFGIDPNLLPMWLLEEFDQFDLIDEEE